jgi:hypothetical protein
MMLGFDLSHLFYATLVRVRTLTSAHGMHGLAWWWYLLHQQVAILTGGWLSKKILGPIVYTVLFWSYVPN